MSRRKKNKRDKYLACAIGCIICFTAITFFLAWNEKTIPDSLIVAWFTAWTVELALLAGIKIRDKNE